MVKSLDELARIKKEAQAMMEVREGKHTTKIIVGMGTCGIAAGARETLGAILDELDKRVYRVAVTNRMWACVSRSLLLRLSRLVNLGSCMGVLMLKRHGIWCSMCEQQYIEI